MNTLSFVTIAFREHLPRWLPNFFTWLRVFLSFVLVMILVVPPEFLALESIQTKLYIFLAVYTVAALTDYLDGFIARKMVMDSDFGKFLDPLADKLMILSVYIAFLFVSVLQLLFIPILLIFLRDVAITALRSYCMNNGIEMETEKHGKWKTVLQISSQVLITGLLIYYMGLFETKPLYSTVQEGASIGIFSLFPVEWLRYTDTPLFLLPFQSIGNHFRESYDFSNLTIGIIRELPNILVTCVMLFSLYSGTKYFLQHYAKIALFLQNKKGS